MYHSSSWFVNYLYFTTSKKIELKNFDIKMIFFMCPSHSGKALFDHHLCSVFHFIYQECFYFIQWIHLYTSNTKEHTVHWAFGYVISFWEFFRSKHFIKNCGWDQVFGCPWFRGCSWMYPVNMSMANNMAVLLLLDRGKLGIMSQAQDARGAWMKFVACSFCWCGEFELNWQMMHVVVYLKKLSLRLVICT